MLKAIIGVYKRHLDYTKTIKELQGLSNRELYDLGIDRSDIITLVHESVYAENAKFNFKHFLDFFKTKTEKNKIEEYLADSANVVDLENRLKQVERGIAPWQIQNKSFAKGWV